MGIGRPRFRQREAQFSFALSDPSLKKKNKGLHAPEKGGEQWPRGPSLRRCRKDLTPDPSRVCQRIENCFTDYNTCSALLNLQVLSLD